MSQIICLILIKCQEESPFLIPYISHKIQKKLRIMAVEGLRDSHLPIFPFSQPHLGFATFWQTIRPLKMDMISMINDAVTQRIENQSPHIV